MHAPPLHSQLQDPLVCALTLQKRVVELETARQTKKGAAPAKLIKLWCARRLSTQQAAPVVVRSTVNDNTVHRAYAMADTTSRSSPTNLGHGCLAFMRFLPSQRTNKRRHIM